MDHGTYPIYCVDFKNPIDYLLFIKIIRLVRINPLTVVRHQVKGYLFSAIEMRLCAESINRNNDKKVRLNTPTLRLINP